MQNPQTAMQHMFGNDPKFQQAITQGIDPKQIMGVLSNFGIKI